MSRGQEILIGLAILICAPIAYSFIMSEIWPELIQPSLDAVAPSGAWGDAFLAGAPIFFLLVIIAFGILLIVGKMHPKDKDQGG